MTGLTDFQVEVARLFFGLPASEGFLLAGGGALLASGLTDRPTHDLDFFGAPDDVDVTAARDQFEDAVADHGWRSERLHDSATFVRLHVTAAEELIVEFAIDSAAGRPPVVSIAGPTFDPEELAGRKLDALLAAPRPATSPTCTRSHSASTARRSWHARTRSTPDSIVSSSPK